MDLCLLYQLAQQNDAVSTARPLTRNVATLAGFELKTATDAVNSWAESWWICMRFPGVEHKVLKEMPVLNRHVAAVKQELLLGATKASLCHPHVFLTCTKSIPLRRLIKSAMFTAFEAMAGYHEAQDFIQSTANFGQTMLEIYNTKEALDVLEGIALPPHWERDAAERLAGFKTAVAQGFGDRLSSQNPESTYTKPEGTGIETTASGRGLTIDWTSVAVSIGPDEAKDNL